MANLGHVTLLKLKGRAVLPLIKLDLREKTVVLLSHVVQRAVASKQKKSLDLKSDNLWSGSTAGG